MSGRSRDLLTSADGHPVTVGRGSLELSVDQHNLIVAMTSDPLLETSLTGTTVAKGFRSTARELLGSDIDRGAFGLLLADVPIALITCNFAVAQWHTYDELEAAGGTATMRRAVTGMCTGFARGSSGLEPDGTANRDHRKRPVPSLEEGPDPLAWHELPEITEMSMRRTRRIDVWRERGVVHVDSMFQDAATRPQRGRVAVHEYTLRASVDGATSVVTSVLAQPRVLPYAECPLAASSAQRLVGHRVDELGLAVSQELRGTVGCTHLNDALRALGDVAALLAELPT